MDRSRGVLIAVAALVVAAFAFAAPGQASFPGTGSTIFFTGYDRTTGGDPHLYSIRSDGSALTSLDNGPAADIVGPRRPGRPARGDSRHARGVRASSTGRKVTTSSR